MHVNHEHQLFPLLKCTTLQWENRIFLKVLSICLKKNCFGKLSDIAFVYLLCPILTKHQKTKKKKQTKKSLDHIMRCKVA